MYNIYSSNKKVEKKLDYFLSIRKDVIQKLERLKINPRRECDAHPLHGKLRGKWSCWLGSNIRMKYIIDDQKMIIWIEDIGSHKIY